MEQFGKSGLKTCIYKVSETPGFFYDICIQPLKTKYYGTDSRH